MNKKYNADYTRIDIYKDYKKNIIKGLQVDQKLHTSIFKDFTLKAREEILVNKSSLVLPFLGTFRIRKYKNYFNNLKHLKVDWANTKKFGVKVYHLNEERGGYYYKWYWDKKAFKNKKIRIFVACRANTRLLAGLLNRYTKNQLDYAE